MRLRTGNILQGKKDQWTSKHGNINDPKRKKEEKKYKVQVLRQYQMYFSPQKNKQKTQPWDVIFEETVPIFSQIGGGGQKLKKT